MQRLSECQFALISNNTLPQLSWVSVGNGFVFCLQSGLHFDSIDEDIGAGASLAQVKGHCPQGVVIWCASGSTDTKPDSSAQLHTPSRGTPVLLRQASDG
ncbi:hypothetical protein WJX73_000748 [Symbiochloris irregularis]|uniref:Uncharacterized protein n=1 Tax=Symbiochloris irregularis TaxID=706552 RepID=A0AAW1NPI9_9CHLO